MNLNEINSNLSRLEGWFLNDNSITKEFLFKDFKEAIVFVNEIGIIAEAHNHHPDITINYNKVTLSLTTHSAKGLTQKDFSLATEIDLINSSS